MAKKIALVLSGCGVKDGSEIHESVLALLWVIKSGAEPLFYAPNMDQRQVVNHLTGEPMQEKRNVLVESARIARGNIKDLRELNSSCADGLIFPGGFGAAINLCTYAIDGENCSVHPEVERVVREFHSASKPIGFICIAPVIAAKILGSAGIELTIGSDQKTAKAIENMGAKHISSDVHAAHIDRNNKIVSTPAYMCARNVAEAEDGIRKLVEAVVELA